VVKKNNKKKRLPSGCRPAQIKKFFNFGNITYSKDGSSIQFSVTYFIDLGLIIKFFQKFPLLTSKRHDFNFFVTVYEMVGRKEHLTI
jgi:hypothetical protein